MERALATRAGPTLARAPTLARGPPHPLAAVGRAGQSLRGTSRRHAPHTPQIHASHAAHATRARRTHTRLTRAPNRPGHHALFLRAQATLATHTCRGVLLLPSLVLAAAFSRPPSQASLVFFDVHRKPQLHGHSRGSITFGDLAGGSRLLLDGSNLAPLGDGLQCVFETPNRRLGNATLNESAVVASFISPTQVACMSPDYALRMGESVVYLNTTYNSSLYDAPPERRQTVNFTYYDRTKPPDVLGLTPPYAPLRGRPIRFAGGLGIWEQWAGDEPVGGVVVHGRNFAPTHFLWCAFGMDAARYTTARGSWKWTRAVYLHSRAVACEVPAGYLGDFPVSATTDDRRYSTRQATLTYYDPSRPAEVSAGQQLAITTAQSGFLRRVQGQTEVDETKPTITLAGANFAPFATHGTLLCRYGPTEILRDAEDVPDNNTDPIAIYENIVPATFLSGERVHCRTPRRQAGTTVAVHLSTGGLRNFSTTFARLTYYDGSSMSIRTVVSAIAPTYGPISGATHVLATGTNFAPTGWSPDAIGTSPLLGCVLNPSNPDGWSTEWHTPPATFIDYNHALCDVGANLYAAVGDVILGVTIRADSMVSRFQMGPQL